MAKAASWDNTDRSCPKAWVANRIRYPGSPRPKRCRLAVGQHDCLVAKLTREIDRLGSTVARLKLKELTGTRTSGG